MPSLQQGSLLKLPHITPIGCENCGGKAHLVLLTADAERNGHNVHQMAIWTFKCAICGHVTQYCVDD